MFEVDGFYLGAAVCWHIRACRLNPLWWDPNSDLGWIERIERRFGIR